MAKLIFLGLALLLVCGSVIGEDPTGNATTTVAPTTTPTPAPMTTPTPAPTTTPAQTTTSTTPPTPEPETTTPVPTTLAPDTTTPPQTTTPAAPTTPAPEMNYKYNVTEHNVTCIMIEGSISFIVNYSTGTNKTETGTLSLPKHPKEDYNVSGTCNGTDGQQEIEVSWGVGNETTNFKLEFTSKDGLWSVSSFTANLYLDPKVFPNATEGGKTLELVIDYGFAPLSVAVNHSFNCHSSLSAANVTGTIGDAAYELPLSSTLAGIQIQAFNEVPSEPDFVTSVHCTADHTSDVVPIAVGCALAALVVIVLIAYLVGRRRRSAAYQSV